MAKGIPVIGRAPDKKAKIINVDELGNLKVSQLESKLDGIENKLVALEQKLTDGSQKVTLSGTINELIKEYKDELVDARDIYFGATRAGDCLPLDVSAYKEVAFTVYNKGDHLVKLWAFQLHPRADLPRNSDHNRILASISMSAGGGDAGDIPAGARLHVSSINYPMLLTPFSGLVLQFYTPGLPSPVPIDIVITGVRV